ncbi:MAG: ABC transporter ATP-binding protein [Lachnospira sp.]
MSIFKSLIRSLKMMERRLPLYLSGIFLMTILNALFEVAGSFFMKTVFDAAGNGTIEQYELKMIVTVILGVISIVLASVFMCIYNNEAKRMTLVMKEKVFDKAMKLPYEYYEEHHSGEIMSKIIYDTDIASNIYSSRLRRVIAPILFVFVFAIAMVIINPFMTVALLAMNTLLFIANTMLSNPIKKVGKHMSQKNTEMTNIISNMIAGVEIVKMYDVYHKEAEKYVRNSNGYANLQKKKMKLSAILDMLNTAFDLLCSLMFVVVGIVLIQRKLATIGEVAAIFTLYTSLSVRFLQLGKNIPELVNCIAYAERIFEFLSIPEENQTIGEVQSDIDSAVTNAVECGDITFGYKEKEPLFINCSYQFPVNHTIAVTGASGCGKSTLVKLLLGFYDLQGGSISILGNKVSNIGIIKTREQIAYVPQVPYMYNISIKENIRYGRLGASDEEIIEAAKLANAHDFIMKQENGYDTILNNRGSNLSGGQRQRIAIARAIIKNSPIILMDEATSALDNESEQLIADAIAGLKNSKTIIMIAHRMTTIQNADIIVEI